MRKDTIMKLAALTDRLSEYADLVESAIHEEEDDVSRISDVCGDSDEEEAFEDRMQEIIDDLGDAENFLRDAESVIRSLVGDEIELQNDLVSFAEQAGE